MGVHPSLVLADLVLAVHLAYAGFIVLGLPLIWTGGLAGWRWVRNRWFRGAHLLAMGIVALESVVGVFCPLTRWEYALRWDAGMDGRYEATFLEYWADRILYHEYSQASFDLIAYGLFAAIAATLFLVPVKWRK